MTPGLEQSLSTLIGAIATAILLAAAYFFGPSARAARRDRAEQDSEPDDDTDG